jgi:hypothetical protein
MYHAITMYGRCSFLISSFRESVYSPQLVLPYLVCRVVLLLNVSFLSEVTQRADRPQTSLVPPCEGRSLCSDRSFNSSQSINVSSTFLYLLQSPVPAIVKTVLTGSRPLKSGKNCALFYVRLFTAHFKYATYITFAT